MKVRNILLLGVFTGIGIAVGVVAWAARGLNETDRGKIDATAVSTSTSAGDEDVRSNGDSVELGGEPIRGGEWRGPDNPAPQTERWYDIRAEEAIDVLGEDAYKEDLCDWVLENTAVDDPEGAHNAVTRLLEREA